MIIKKNYVTKFYFITHSSHYHFSELSTKNSDTMGF